MDTAHKKNLTENRIFLVHNIDFNEIEDGLHDVFNSEMLDSVRRERDPPSQMRNVLNDLPKRGPKAYDIFIRVLTEAGYDDIVDDLDESLGKIRLQKHEPAFPDDVAPHSNSNVTRTWNSQFVPPINQRTEETSDSYRICEFWSDVTELSKLRATFARDKSDKTLNQLEDQHKKCLADQREIHRMMQRKQTSEILDQLTKLVDSLNEEFTAYRDSLQRLKTEAYDTRRPSRGHMLIYNNSDFPAGSGYCQRTGSEKDTENLKLTFENFGFVVTTCENKTVKEMQQCLTTFHREAVTDPLCSSVIIVLASHGRQEKRGIIASDGGIFNLDWVICRFCRDCATSLAGKPKMIIMQCCRGKQFDVVRKPTEIPKPLRHDAAESSTDLHEPVQLEKDAEPEDEESQPATQRAQMADYLIAHSTVDGKVSWRDRESGSWFIQAICEIFREYSPKEHVMDMLIRVNERLSTMEGSIVVQQPNPECMLTRKWFLWPS